MNATTHLCPRLARIAGLLTIPLTMFSQGRLDSAHALLPVPTGNEARVDTTATPLPPSDQPEVVWPRENASRVSHRPLFRWRTVTGASGYFLEIAKDSSFQEQVCVDSVRADTVLRSGTLLAPEQTYAYRVRALNAGGSGPWSATGLLRTSSPPLPETQVLLFPPTRRGARSRLDVALRGSALDTLMVDSTHTSSTLFRASVSPDATPGGDDTVRILAEFHPERFGLHADTLLVHTTEGIASVLLLGASPPPVLTTTRRVLSLGPVAVEDTATGYVALHNSGTINDLTVLNMFHFSGAFLSPGPGLYRIPPRDSLMVQVRFTAAAYRPRAYGVHTDTLVIDSDGGVIKLPLRGESPHPVMHLSPRRIAFGPTGIADTTGVLLRVTNSSVNVLEIDSLFTAREAFLVPGGPFVIARGDTVSIPVRFHPRKFGDHADTLTLRANSRPARGIIPLAGVCPTPVIVPSPSRLAFGTVEERTHSRLTIAIGNSSPSVLRIDSMMTGTRAFGVPRFPEFGALRQGDSLHFPVTFDPDTTGDFADTVLVFNSSPASPARIPLAGVGAPGSDVAGRGTGIPVEFELGQNYPNPFNGATTIRFGLPARSQVRLLVFNSIGQELALLAEGELPPGYHEASWRTDAASGIYFCRLEAVPFGAPGQRAVRTRKLIVIR